ncbi:hypothetical protein [Brachyspira hyodysenteriae]|uniref:hypothetical protein n=1 Tax=Brachyspira hyodysenteriae TaxID=159 RepID=UPI00063D9C05|nr:hypothetical protein [Brachyspira hyodysenteriae]KLI30744.1 hypothetical protein SZ49_05505 [Brachyspira hyodysenteriae]
MRKLIFLFTLLLSFSLYSATLPQGLIKEEKNGITRITTTNPNFKLVMEIWGGSVELKWESIFKNDKGFIYSSPRYGYDYGETISDFGSYKLFTVPIGDFGQVLTSGNYVVSSPYVIDIDHPVYSVNNIRYLIYAFVLDPLESTELYGYRSGLYSQSAYITLNKKDMEEVKKLLEYYIDYTEENNITIFQDYYSNSKTHQEVINNLKEKANTLKNNRMEKQQLEEEIKRRIKVENNTFKYTGDEIDATFDINEYNQFRKLINEFKLYDVNAYFTKSIINNVKKKSNYKIYLTFKNIDKIKKIELKPKDRDFIFGDIVNNNTIATLLLADSIPGKRYTLKIYINDKEITELISEVDKKAINIIRGSYIYDIIEAASQNLKP